eukprot:8976163-Alexandrium_andersonii.AAC.1
MGTAVPLVAAPLVAAAWMRAELHAQCHRLLQAVLTLSVSIWGCPRSGDRVDDHASIPLPSA